MLTVALVFACWFFKFLVFCCSKTWLLWLNVVVVLFKFFFLVFYVSGFCCSKSKLLMFLIVVPVLELVISCSCVCLLLFIVYNVV